MPFINVRWTDNTDDLRKHLAQGLDQIEATRQSVDKLVKSLKGEQLAIAAHKWAAAIEEVGGVTKLTAQNQERANALFQRFIEQQQALGAIVPKTIRDLAAQTQASVSAANAAKQHGEAIGRLKGILQAGLGALGVGVGGATGIALLAREAFDAADALTKLSDRTGAGVVALQRLDAIARPSGNSVDELADAINKFQKNLAEGDKDAGSALTRIGLSFEAIRDQSPDQQFIAIAKAIQAIKDPAQQTLIAVQLFGRGGAEILPSLKAKVDELAAGTHAMSADSVKALDELGDEFGRLKTNAVHAAGEILAAFVRMAQGIKTALDRPGVGEVLGVGASDRSLFHVERQQGTPTDLGSRPQVGIGALVTGGRALNADALAAVTAQLNAQRLAADHLGLSLEDYQQKYAEASRIVQAALAGLDAQLRGINPTIAAQVQGLMKSGEWLDAMAPKYGLTAIEVRALSTQIEIQKKVTELATGASRSLESAVSDVGRVDVETIPALERRADAIDRIRKIEQEAAGALAEGALRDAGVSTDQSPFRLKEDLAHIAEAAQASLDAMKAAVERAGKVDAESFAHGFSGVLQSIPDLLERAFVGGGGLEGAVRALGLRLGGTISESLLQSGLGQHLADGIGKLFGVKTAGGAGTVVSGLKAGLSGGIAALVDLGIGKLLSIGQPSRQELEGRSVEAQFQQQFGSFEKMAKAIGDAYAATGRGAQQAEADINRLMAAERQGAEATQQVVDQITAAFTQQKEEADALQQAIEKYHFSLKDLGQTFQQQQLERRSATIAREISALLNINVPIETILRRMGASINRLVSDAVRYGLTLPAALKPILDILASEGKLTVGGQRVSSLDQLNLQFSDQADSAFDRLIVALDRLTVQLGGRLPGGAQIPGRGTGTGSGGGGGGGAGGTEPPAAATGGIVRAWGIQHYASGGIVPFPRGRDTVPAMLAPREMILTDAQQANLWHLANGRMNAEAISGGGDVVVHMHNDLRGSFGVDQHALDRWGRRLTPSIVKAIFHNKDGTYSAARAALGLRS